MRFIPVNAVVNPYVATPLNLLGHTVSTREGKSDGSLPTTIPESAPVRASHSRQSTV